MKFSGNRQFVTHPYFWRTYTGSELDYVEESGDRLCGYEVKWKKRKTRAPKTFQKTYPQAEFAVIDQDNFFEFISMSANSSAQ